MIINKSEECECRYIHKNKQIQDNLIPYYLHNQSYNKKCHPADPNGI